MSKFSFPKICKQRKKLTIIHNQLVECGYLEFARDTEEVIQMIDIFEIQIEKKIKHLSNIWNTIDLHNSMNINLPKNNE